eukprot:UC1_evm5s1979
MYKRAPLPDIESGRRGGMMELSSSESSFGVSGAAMRVPPTTTEEQEQHRSRSAGSHDYDALLMAEQRRSAALRQRVQDLERRLTRRTSSSSCSKCKAQTSSLATAAATSEAVAAAEKKRAEKAEKQADAFNTDLGLAREKIAQLERAATAVAAKHADTLRRHQKECTDLQSQLKAAEKAAKATAVQMEEKDARIAAAEAAMAEAITKAAATTAAAAKSTTTASTSISSSAAKQVVHSPPAPVFKPPPTISTTTDNNNNNCTQTTAVSIRTMDEAARAEADSRALRKQLGEALTAKAALEREARRCRADLEDLQSQFTAIQGELTVLLGGAG